jgi:tRNA threonylcarbamoyladenosine biosynthesis protein TsaE
MNMVFLARTEAEMCKVGETIAAELQAGDWIAIDAPLGAGKTVLCTGILRGLGFLGEVASPSYAIVLQYEAPDVQIPVQHADLYRLHSADEIEEIGLQDCRADCITLVEWAKNGGNNFGNPTYRIVIALMDDGIRHISMTKANG